ncbi:Mor family transcriptional regulator [Clostridium moniliforme]|uniref:Mor family transcriptional regulator n=1 Tax=Clostridium moniliforme TaxID=39489 RepID=A0ABS4F3B9_9CLOT|nr:CD3324 family protein [Clostridium moniliforme]MBP1890760.1 Mor family transcriptional regulator [Clostridium moniliforme]
MKYIKAKDVLPNKILKIIQEYVDGEYLYIPRKECNHKSWGEKSGIKNSLRIRNNEIYNKYLNGATINSLTKEYFLSEKSIQRIIYEEKRLCL